MRAVREGSPFSAFERHPASIAHLMCRHSQRFCQLGSSTDTRLTARVGTWWQVVIGEGKLLAIDARCNDSQWAKSEAVLKSLVASWRIGTAAAPKPV